MNWQYRASDSQYGETILAHSNSDGVRLNTDIENKHRQNETNSITELIISNSL